MISHEAEELRLTLDRARALLDSLVVRGLRACGADELAQARAFADEFERAGAAHAASALARLHDEVEKGTREGARALLMAQTSVRMLERLLTLRVVTAQYAMDGDLGLDGDDDDGPDAEGEDDAAG